jgi:hypothetical protein
MTRRCRGTRRDMAGLLHRAQGVAGGRACETRILPLYLSTSRDASASSRHVSRQQQRFFAFDPASPPRIGQQLTVLNGPSDLLRGGETTSTGQSLAGREARVTSVSEPVDCRDDRHGRPPRNVAISGSSAITPALLAHRLDFAGFWGELHRPNHPLLMWHAQGKTKITPATGFSDLRERRCLPRDNSPAGGCRIRDMLSMLLCDLLANECGNPHVKSL